jgi:methyl-accepting chemotaxis protein
MIALIIGMSMFSIQGMETLAELTHKMYRHPLTVSNAVRDVNTGIVKMHRSMKDVALAQNDAALRSAAAQVDLYEKAVYATFRIIEERFLGDKSDVESLEVLFQDWKPIRDEVIGLMRQGKRGMAAEITKGKGAVHVAALETAAKALIDFASNKADSFLANAQEAAQRAYTTMYFVIAMVVLVGILIAYLISRSITGPLATAMRAADRISEGDLDVHFVVDSKDEVGQLLASMQQMVSYINEIAGVAQRVAAGDVQVQVRPKSNRDVLNRAFAETIGYIQELANVAERVAAGDLQVRVQPKSERDVLNTSFAKMVANLSGIIHQLVTSSNQIFNDTSQQSKAAAQTSSYMGKIATTIGQVASNTQYLTSDVAKTSTSIKEMAASIQSVAQNTGNLADSVEDTSVTIREMVASIDQVATNSREVGKSSESAVQEARDGAGAVEKTVAGMEQISETMQGIVTVIKGLHESSKKINTIVDVIDNIAEQTNLLALNAAIEAARAGEHGRGFAVVADEIRKLAERSASSAKKIVTLISGIQKDTGRAISVTDEGYHQATEGVRLATQAGGALGKISQAISNVNHKMSEISKVTDQQARTSDKMVKSVDNMKRVTQEVTASTKEQATNSQKILKAVETMNKMTLQVSQATEEQRRGGEQIVKAIENVAAISAKLDAQAKGLQQVTTNFKV